MALSTDTRLGCQCSLSASGMSTRRLKSNFFARGPNALRKRLFMSSIQAMCSSQPFRFVKSASRWIAMTLSLLSGFGSH